MQRRSFYTTFEISQICGVNPTTVQNWVKGKRLKAFQTPGGHRRIQHEDLVEFMNKFEIPVPLELTQSVPMIMLVDDEASILDVLENLMKTSEMEVNVVKVQSGVEALLMIGETKPDLLILDIMMPGMNGFEICKKLKLNPNTQNIKIAAISGDHNPMVRERILNSGADLFFTKPLDIVAFRDKCFKLIQI
jgi:excisionase family DNA binding protein